jgi:hypothetical protein
VSDLAELVAGLRRVAALLGEIDDDHATLLGKAVDRWLSGIDDIAQAAGLPPDWRRQLRDEHIAALIGERPEFTDSALARHVLNDSDDQSRELRRLEPHLTFRSWRRVIGQLRSTLANTGASRMLSRWR